MRRGELLRYVQVHHRTCLVPDPLACHQGFRLGQGLWVDRGSPRVCDESEQLLWYLERESSQGPPRMEAPGTVEQGEESSRQQGLWAMFNWAGALVVTL